MKNILLIISLLLILSSCKKNFDPEFYGELVPSTFPSNDAEFELYTLELYEPFQCRWPYEDGGTKFHFHGLEEGHVQLFDHPTDLFVVFSGWGEAGPNWESTSRGSFATHISKGRDRSHFEKIR